MGNCTEVEYIANPRAQTNISVAKPKTEEIEKKVEHNTEAKIEPKAENIKTKEQSKIQAKVETKTEAKTEPKIQTKVQPKVIAEKKFEKDENYEIPNFKQKLQEALQLLEGGDQKFYYPLLQFLQKYIKDNFRSSGKSLYEVQEIVEKDVKKALKNYPVHARDQLIESKLIPSFTKYIPDLVSDIKVQNQENLTDRSHQLIFKCREYQNQFHSQLHNLFVKELSAVELKCGAKVPNDATKCWLRIWTKVLQPFIDPVLKSRQAYTDLNHHFWGPVYNFLSKTIKQNLGKIKFEIYDLLRAKAIFRNVQEVERAYQIFYRKYEKDIFRAKNRLNNPLTGDVLINMMYKGLAVQIQIAIQCDDKKQMFHHKLYELTRQALGMSFALANFFLEPAQDNGQYMEQIETDIGWIKCVQLREKIPEGYERMTIEDAIMIPDDVQKFLGQWTIIALKQKKLQGYGYGSPICNKRYCLQCGQMMLIKRKNEHYTINVSSCKFQ